MICANSMLGLPRGVQTDREADRQNMRKTLSNQTLMRSNSLLRASGSCHSICPSLTGAPGSSGDGRNHGAGAGPLLGAGAQLPEKVL